ncbi:MAG: peroxide stress protein YaaA [Flavobacteriales bacterium]
MLTIISPAKSLNFDDLNKEVKSSVPNYLNQSQEIISIIKQLENKELMDLMSISQDLAQLNYDRFQNWSLPFNTDNSKQAIF